MTQDQWTESVSTECGRSAMAVCLNWSPKNYSAEIASFLKGRHFPRLSRFCRSAAPQDSHPHRQPVPFFVTRRFCVLTGIIFALLTTHNGHALAGVAQTNVFPNPGLTNPRMKFNTGKVVRGVPQFSPLLPSIPGPLSGWWVWMAHRSQYLNGSEMIRNDGGLKDPHFGPAAYVFTTPNQNARLAIYRNHSAHQWVYDLFEKNGPLDPGGGANLFLSANAKGGPFSMNHPIIYSLWAKIAQAHVRYYNPGAARSGAVVAQVFSGFILKFHSHNPRHRITLFMQIHMADSRSWLGRTGGITDKQGTWSPAGAVLDFDLAPPGGDPFRFRPDRGPLHYLRYNLRPFLEEVLSAKPPLCQQADGRDHHLTFMGRVRNLKNWTLTSVYVGLETENRISRPGISNHGPQGTVSVALQLMGLRVISDGINSR